MGLRINTNIAALNGQRNLSATTAGLRKTFERLSSGLRINHAADDAAGLAISEKLRAQIKGYAQAVRNAQDGINLIQTAEGGINETVNILQRMRELAIQASNDTNTHFERQKIQEELIQLRQELTRITQTVQFNTRNLLDGSLQASRVERGPMIDLKQNFRVGNTTATVTDIRDFIVQGSIRDDISMMTNAIDVDNTFMIELVGLDAPTFTAGTPALNRIGLRIRSSVEDRSVPVTTGGADLSVVTLSNLTTVGGRATIILTMVNGATQLGLATFQIDLNSISLEDTGKAAMIHIASRQRAITVDQSLTFHVGPNQGQIVRVNVDELTAKGLKMEDLSVVSTLDPRIYGRDADLADFMRAQEAIGAIDVAINQVNSMRARLGALQNRLESTIRSLDVSHENLSASESRIRDADIAKETAELTKQQILVQAGTAVLAQANVSSQSALALLGGGGR